MANQWYRDNYLKSQDWKNLRGAIIAHCAPDSKCWICDQIKPLDVHHLMYRKNIWDARPLELICVCRECHTRIHECFKRTPNLQIRCRSIRRALRTLRILFKNREEVAAIVQNDELKLAAFDDYWNKGSMRNLKYLAQGFGHVSDRIMRSLEEMQEGGKRVRREMKRKKALTYQSQRDNRSLY